MSTRTNEVRQTLNASVGWQYTECQLPRNLWPPASLCILTRQDVRPKSADYHPEHMMSVRVISTNSLIIMCICLLQVACLTVSINANSYLYLHSSRVKTSNIITFFI